MTYDPERNVLYRLAPEFEIVEPRVEHIELSFTGHLRTLLDYTCHELERRGPEGTARVWVAPRIRVDPNAFRKLEYRGFVKQLEFTGGALELDAEVEGDGYTLVVKALRVERRELDESTWRLEEARALARWAP